MANEYSFSNRLEKKIQRIISYNLIHSIKDNRLKTISIDEVKLTKDLSIAKIYCSSAIKEETKKLEILLSKATGFFKKEIANSLSIKRIPELQFVIDNHEVYANKINNLIEEAVNNDKKEK